MRLPSLLIEFAFLMWFRNIFFLSLKCYTFLILHPWVTTAIFGGYCCANIPIVDIVSYCRTRRTQARRPIPPGPQGGSRLSSQSTPSPGWTVFNHGLNRVFTVIDQCVVRRLAHDDASSYLHRRSLKWTKVRKFMNYVRDESKFFSV